MAEELTMAAALGNLQRVMELLDSGVNPNTCNSYGRTAIQVSAWTLCDTASRHMVMMMGSPRLAQLLIDHGADPTVPDPTTGTCPAHDAIREGFVDTLVILVNGGARVDGPQDKCGQRPLDLASPSVMRELIARGVVGAAGR
ncbi:cyclin-dependent kinase 4 inhibitor B-like isoform X1 [Dendropsophus ebraccatus]|uniref:cyclin-dependent kinase 4 inhibitor B-like isoform X1 n=1 Tax=Dendropsophus ebraccatus TaxID=150705 RepID=UPI003831F317